MAPFMERSHVQIENYFVLKHNRQKFTRIANNAKFAVINCNSLPIIEFLKKLNWVEINECSSNYKLLIPDR